MKKNREFRIAESGPTPMKAVKSPRISIIVPAYNVATYIDAAMRSLLDQRVPAHEILVFDDGSADETWDRVQRYADYPNVRLYAHANRGLGPTRNRGVRQATGDYLYFFDADDLLDPGFVEAMQDRVRAGNQPDLILFSAHSFADDPANAQAPYQYRRKHEATGLTGLQALSLLIKPGWLYAPVWLYLVRRDFWHATGLSFEPILYEDEALIVPLIAGAQAVSITDQVYVQHRVRAGSLSSSREITQRHVAGRAKVLEHAITAISLIPRKHRDTRRFMRKRCRIFARKYLATALRADERIRVGLMLHALCATGNIRLARSLFVDAWKAGRLRFWRRDPVDDTTDPI